MAIIKTHFLVYQAASIPAQPGEKQLPNPRIKDGKAVRSMGGPAWHPDGRFDEYNSYFATPALLNTKYVVDAVRHPTIGCVVTLTSGKSKHYDVDLEQIMVEGNRR